MSNSCRVKLKCGTFEIEVEGSEDFVEKKTGDFPIMIEKVLATHQSIIPSLSLEESTYENIEESEDKIIKNKSMTINGFLNEKKFNSDVDFTIGICFYLSEHVGKKRFVSLDIKEMFKSAKKPLPTNIAQCITESVKKDYLYDTGEKIGLSKLYEITDNGKKYVEEYIAPEKSTKKGNKKTIKTSTSEMLDVPLDTLKLDKYPKVEALTKFKEQLLIVMQIYTDNASIEWFSANDLYCILKEKFKISTKVQQIRDTLDSFKTDIDSRKEDKKLKEYKLMVGGINKAKEIISSYEEAKSIK